MATPNIKHLIKSCQPDELENQICYQILGFDILVDNKLVPSLLEINQMPSFATGSPLDYELKRGIIVDTLKLLCMTVQRKKEMKEEKRMKMQERLLKP